jgi:hypothetical protein
MNDLKRIANALEHLALPVMSHDLKQCSICQQKKKPIKKMPQSVVMTPERIRKREEELRRQQLLNGPEQPVGDMFRYREIKS